MLALGGSCWGMERKELDESHESPACASPAVASAKDVVLLNQYMLGHVLGFLHPVEVARACLVSKDWNGGAEKLGADMLWAQFSREPAALRGFFYHVPMSPRDSEGNVDSGLQQKNFLWAIKFLLENFEHFGFLSFEIAEMGDNKVTPQILEAFQDNWGIDLSRRFGISLRRESAARQFLDNMEEALECFLPWTFDALPPVDEKAVVAGSLCAMRHGVKVYGRDVQKPEDLHKARDLIEKLVDRGDPWAEDQKIRGIFSGAYGYTQDPARVLWMASQGNFAAIKTLIMSNHMIVSKSCERSEIRVRMSNPQGLTRDILILLATFIPKKPVPGVATLPPAASSASAAASVDPDSASAVAVDSDAGGF